MLSTTKLSRESTTIVSKSLHQNNRVELFFKTNDDLRKRIQFLKSHGFEAFNLVNKHKTDNMNEYVNCIRKEFPEAHICSHYSLKYQKLARKNNLEQKQKLVSHLEYSKADEHLIISGSGKKVSWNTLEALKLKIKSSPFDTEGTATSPKNKDHTIAIAYNPYFPGKSDRQAEYKRLQKKLSPKNDLKCNKVYLQFGTDLKHLEQALEKLQAFENNPQISGSLFLPTKKLIAQQKFRPWNGVFLSEEFLSGPEEAKKIVVEMITMYQKYNVEILWEAPGIQTEQDVELVKELLMLASSNAQQQIQDTNYNNDNTNTVANDSASDESEKPKASPITKKLPSTLPDIEKRIDEPAIVLFGSHDVRIYDNLALQHALMNHKSIIPVFLWTKPINMWGITGAMEVILKDALKNLESNLSKNFNIDFVCRNCSSIDGTAELKELIQKTGAVLVCWNSDFTPEGRLIEEKRRKAIPSGVTLFEAQSSLLYNPDVMELSSGFHGGHWGTLMPFLKNCKKTYGEPRRPLDYTETKYLLENTKNGLQAEGETLSNRVNSLDMAKITGKDKWDLAIRERFPMSEKEAQISLDAFFQNGLKFYEKDRSRADKDYATSKLSPHLRIGTLSPNELYWRTKDSKLSDEKVKTFSRRLFWRDLAYFQLKCFPQMREVSIRSHYEDMEWVEGDEKKKRLEAWKNGKTGYPIVDAGMRELYMTGWMTQSLRMVVASFLVEYLRVSWVEGCKWFHYTLADADSAINAMMWQNAGKCGIDQWNFVLSPTTASQDPFAEYTSKWVPELSGLPSKYICRPWEASKEELSKSKVVLGKTYPLRIVDDLKAERRASITSTLEMRRNNQKSNTDRGYDVIVLPDGESTVVFTKKEYRIGRDGNVIVESHTNRGNSKSRQSKRRRK